MHNQQLNRICWIVHIAIVQHCNTLTKWLTQLQDIYQYVLNESNIVVHNTDSL